MKRWPKISVSWEMIPYLSAAAILGGRAPVLWIFFLLAVHECGHILAALCLNVSLKEIRIHPYGLIARSDQLDYTHSVKECIIAAAGPLFQIMGQGCIMICASKGWISAAQREWLSMMNRSMLVFNLLPMMPLDGGRLVRGLLHIWLPYTRAECWSAISSLAVILVLVMLHPQQGIWFWMICGGCLIRSWIGLNRLSQQRLAFYYHRYCHPCSYDPKYHRRNDLYRNHHNYIYTDQMTWEEKQWLGRFFDPDKTV